jgi:hypothetical protein
MTRVLQVRRAIPWARPTCNSRTFAVSRGPPLGKLASRKIDLVLQMVKSLRS